MKPFTCIILLVLSTTFSPVKSQDLMDLLNEDKPTTEYAYATFKTTHLVIGQSVENPAAGVLQFLVSHNFGRINQGAYEFFGLDQSTIRLGLDYGINDWLSVGLGRSSYQKTIDGSVKAKIFRQSSGARNFPVTVTWYSNIMLNTTRWQNTERTNLFTSRLSYTHQLLVARKFSNALSLQLMPTVVHKNLVLLRDDPNDIYSIGAGGRAKITQRTSVNAEYYYVLGKTGDVYENALSLGLDVETGGHVFQFRITNAQPLFERAFITETSGKWSKGDIYFGFTINRVFTIAKPKSFR